MPEKGVIETLDVRKPLQAKPVSRRGFLQAATFALGGMALGPVFAKAAITQDRCLAIHCPNTGETMRVIYWTPGDGYIKPSMDELSWVMRDFHLDVRKSIDPKVLDQLYALQLQLKPKQPIHIISGYRSPTTNARMRLQNRGVAKDSLHMRGMAVDLRMPDRDIKDLYRAALSMKAGGVGYYPRSKFIHIDSGVVRSWS